MMIKACYFFGTLSTVLGIKLNKDICAFYMTVCAYTFVFLPVSLAENGQINETQRSVSCAQINQSTVDNRDVAQAEQRLQRAPDKDTNLEKNLHSTTRHTYGGALRSKLFTDKLLQIPCIFCTRLQYLKKSQQNK